MNMCIYRLVLKRLIQLDAKRFAEEALKRDSRIRYVAIVDRQFSVLVSQMRRKELLALLPMIRTVSSFS